MWWEHTSPGREQDSLYVQVHNTLNSNKTQLDLHNTKQQTRLLQPLLVFRSSALLLLRTSAHKTEKNILLSACHVLPTLCYIIVKQIMIMMMIMPSTEIKQATQGSLLRL
jgi:hypothetical protein